MLKPKKSKKIEEFWATDIEEVLEADYDISLEDMGYGDSKSGTAYDECIASVEFGMKSMGKHVCYFYDTEHIYFFLGKEKDVLARLKKQLNEAKGGNDE